MLKKLLPMGLALLLLPLLAVSVQAEGFKEGVHYTKLPQPVRTQNPAKVEVVEAFGYWCPHCDRFERYLEPWKLKKPEYVDFKRIPIIFRPNQTEFAKAYFVAEALGKTEQAHPALFSLIHRQRSWINTKEQLAEFFAGFNVGEVDFNKAYSSFSINSQLNLSKKKAREYGIKGVPSMVVNGKYLVDAQAAGSQKKMLEVVNYLVAQEKAALK